MNSHVGATRQPTLDAKIAATVNDLDMEFVISVRGIIMVNEGELTEIKKESEH
jgi:hypothetical protein